MGAEGQARPGQPDVAIAFDGGSLEGGASTLLTLDSRGKSFGYPILGLPIEA